MNGSTRRTFFKTAGAGIAAASAIARVAYADGGDTLRIGLVGCGGRGTGAADDALHGDSNTKLVAMGDLFGDYLETARKTLIKGYDTSRVDVPPERCFVGFDAYKHVIDSVDVVCLATTPHFRPLHLKYAVEKGVHAFVEKPVATDPAGVRDIMATCRRAEEKGLAIVSGLCWRYDRGKRATVQRIHDGSIGDIVTCETYYMGGTLWNKVRKPEWSEMEYQQRNWYYYDWLSGDFNVEQHIHSLDKIAWVMGDRYPVRVTAMGGRQQRTAAAFGNIYDHFCAAYEYEDGVKAYAYCRQMADTSTNVTDKIFGTEGAAALLGNPDDHITDRSGRTVWKHEIPRGQKRDNMYRTEHEELFASIRAGEPINNGDYMSKSTLMAIMMRESAYSGRALTWEEVWNSPLNHAPPAYEWGPAPMRPVAIPGRYTIPV